MQRVHVSLILILIEIAWYYFFEWSLALKPSWIFSKLAGMTRVAHEWFINEIERKEKLK